MKQRSKEVTTEDGPFSAVGVRETGVFALSTAGSVPHEVMK